MLSRNIIGGIGVFMVLGLLFGCNQTNVQDTLDGKFLPHLEVTSYLPQTGSVNVSIEPEFSISFNSIPNLDSLSRATVLLAGSIEQPLEIIPDTDQTILFRPVNKLDIFTTYRLVITPEAVNQYNKPLQEAFELIITTGGFAQQPNAAILYPIPGENNVSLALKIIIGATSPLDLTSLQTIQLIHVDSQTPLSFTIESINETSYRLIPDTILESNSVYQIIIPQTVVDTEGVNIAEEITSTFKTGLVGDIIPPGVPENLQVVRESSSTATISWDLLPETELNEDIHKYIIVRTETPPFTGSLVDQGVYVAGDVIDEGTLVIGTVAKSLNHYTDTNLETQKHYQYYIYSMDLSGNYSEPATHPIFLDVSITNEYGEVYVNWLLDQEATVQWGYYDVLNKPFEDTNLTPDTPFPTAVSGSHNFTVEYQTVFLGVKLIGLDNNTYSMASSETFLAPYPGSYWTKYEPKQWSGRSYFCATVFKNRVYIIGGLTDTGLENDVWWSEDGYYWIQEPDAPWAPRYDGKCAVLNDELYIMGGHLGSSNSNEVWKTADGVNWENMNPTGHWGPRRHHMAVAHNGELYVMGGFTDPIAKDVWKSSDGTNWVQMPWPGWANRGLAGAISWDGKLWISGGAMGGCSPTADDIWTTEDGTSWTNVGTTTMKNRWAHSMFAYDEKLWIHGSHACSGVLGATLISSVDGVDWYEYSSGPNFVPNLAHAQSVVLNGQPMVIGGELGGKSAAVYFMYIP